MVEEADAGLAGAGAGAGQAEREGDVGLAGLAVRSERCGSRAWILTQAPSRRRGRGKPSASRDRHAGGGQRGRGVAARGPRPSGAGSGARSGRRRSARRPRWAACGSNPRRSRRTRCPARVADEQAARGAHARRERLGRRRPRAAGARARAPRRTPARPPCRRRAPCWAPRARRGSPGRRSPRRSASPRRARPGPADRALSASTSAPAEAITVRSDGPANPSMPTTPRHLPLGLLHPQAARARRSRPPAGSTRCRTRARRPPARR